MVQFTSPANPATVASSASGISRAGRVLIAIASMALAANCFLKYLWWTACYSAWSGIPKMAEQWKAAGARATFNGWSLIVLGVTSVAVLSSLIHMRSSRLPILLKTGVRVGISLATTIAGTAIFALVLSWFKQGMQ
jgi:hypothetical protein